jgi:5-methylcytosine-specific restriction endonuclease McrA
MSKIEYKIKNRRIRYDSSKYYEEMEKLPAPDGKHCVICGKPLPKYRRKYCSDECFRTWLATIEIKDWNEVRAIVLERDHYTCQNCGSKENLEVHHVIPIYDGGEEFNVDNCITLCHKCHNVAGRRYKLSKKGQTSLDKYLD